MKSINLCLSLQRGAFASPRSLQTSRWCWGSGWCCPAWSSTTAASFSGPKMAWPWVLARACEVSAEDGEGNSELAEVFCGGWGGGTCVSSPRCRRQREVERGIKSATVRGSVLTVKALTKAFPCLQKCRGRSNIKGLSREAWVTIWAEMSPVHHAELEEIPCSADKGRTYPRVLSRHAHPQWLSAAVRKHFSLRRREAAWLWSPKRGESKGQSRGRRGALSRAGGSKWPHRGRKRTSVPQCSTLCSQNIIIIIKKTSF